MELPDTFHTEYLPDIWLKAYEDEPPGYLRAVKGDLDCVYIKELTSMPIWAPGRPPVEVGRRLAYVWVRVHDDPGDIVE